VGVPPEERIVHLEQADQDVERVEQAFLEPPVLGDRLCDRRPDCGGRAKEFDDFPLVENEVGRAEPKDVVGAADRREGGEDDDAGSERRGRGAV